jgi:hypothetical protein
MGSTSAAMTMPADVREHKDKNKNKNNEINNKTSPTKQRPSTKKTSVLRNRRVKFLLVSDQSSSCVAGVPPLFVTVSCPTSPSFAFSCATGSGAGPAPHLAFCSTSFFGSQCTGNGLVGSIGG